MLLFEWAKTRPRSHLCTHSAVFLNELRAKGFLAEMYVAGSDAVYRLNDLPLLCLRHERMKRLASRHSNRRKPHGVRSASRWRPPSGAPGLT